MTDKTIPQMIELLLDGRPQAALAAEIGANQSDISLYLRGRMPAYDIGKKIERLYKSRKRRLQRKT